MVNELFDLAHHFSEPARAAIDSILYLLEMRSLHGVRAWGAVGIPLSIHCQRTKLVFPIRGAFVVANGTVAEGGHHERSQQYAYDFVGWGREVIAPGDGVVAYGRNDVPDNVVTGTIDAGRLQELPQPMWAIAGNVVLIDHENGEFSMIGLLGNSGHSEGPHLHCHLMDGPVLYRQDGLPSRFDNIEGGVPLQGNPTEAK